MKYDLVITRHAPLVTVLRERGIIEDTTPVITHVDDPSVLDGRHVIGVLPHHLSARCASITEVPMALTPADREAMRGGDLPVERTREIAGEPVTYIVSRQPHPDAALRAALDELLTAQWFAGRDDGEGGTAAEVRRLRREYDAALLAVRRGPCPVCGGAGGANGCGEGSGYEGPCHAGPYTPVGV